MQILEKNYTIHDAYELIRLCSVKTSEEEQVPAGDGSKKMKYYWEDG